MKRRPHRVILVLCALLGGLSLACALDVFRRAESGTATPSAALVQPEQSASVTPAQKPPTTLVPPTATKTITQAAGSTAASGATITAPVTTALHPQPTQTGRLPLIKAIDFVDAHNGWMVTADSGRLLRTTDGGETWRDVTPDELHVWSASIVDALSAWTVDKNFDPAGMKDIVYRTLDGGKTWQSIQAPFKQAQVSMLDVQNGWATELPYGCGAGSCWVGLYTTTDGSESWQQLLLVEPGGAGDGIFPGLIALPSGQGVWLSDLDTIWLYGDQTLGILQGRYASLTVSRDAGRTWEELVIAMPDDAPGSGVPQFISYPTFLSSATGYFSAIYSNPTPENELPSGYIAFFGTQDGGQSWTALPSVVEVNPYAVFVEYVSPQRFILLCGQRLCQSKDGGRNWDVLESDIQAVLQTGGVVVDMDFVNNVRGWIAVSQEGQGATLYRTVDGGSTWDALPSIVE